jgi:hypothetical protein
MTLKELVESVSKLRGWEAVLNHDRDAASLSVPQSGNRRQVVAISQFKDEEHAMIRFTTLIGGTDRLEAARMRSALELNLRLPHGCLAFDGTQLVMTETRPLKTSTPETTGDALEFMARQADTYEKLIYNTDEH